MGTAKTPKPVKLFASIIFRGEESLHKVEEKLAPVIGKIQEKTATMPFSHTAYYEKEMGKNLDRCLILFEPLFQREILPEIKLKANETESFLLMDGKRTANIDPGYISLEHVVLATTKGFAHRVYLGQGIYADLTLMYQNRTFKPLEWTYPDYGGEEFISIFNGWRNYLKEMLKK
jgi:hypothetical protein